MKFRIDKSLQDYLDETLEAARLKRNGIRRGRNAAFTKALEEAEAAGNAMRYVDAKGQVAWKATPRFREDLEDLRVDAQADAEAEDV